MIEQQTISFNTSRYIDAMTRKEHYEWDNHEIKPTERLEMLITVARRGLGAERSENPGLEMDLVSLEEIQEHSQEIIDRRWWVALAAGALAPVIEGIAAGLFFGNIPAGIGCGLTAGIISLPIVATLGKEISGDLIFTPAANRFVGERLGLQK